MIRPLIVLLLNVSLFPAFGQDSVVGKYIGVCKDAGVMIIRKDHTFECTTSVPDGFGTRIYGSWSVFKDLLILESKSVKGFKDRVVIGKIELMCRKRHEMVKVDSFNIKMPLIIDRWTPHDKCYLVQKVWKDRGKRVKSD